MYRVQDLFEKHKETLGLELIAGQEGIKRSIKVAEVHSPGLSLSGYLKNYVCDRVLIFGNVEILYLKDLGSPELRRERLKSILAKETPAVIFAGRFRPPNQKSRV